MSDADNNIKEAWKSDGGDGETSQSDIKYCVYETHITL